MSEIKKTTAVISIGGKEITINKLKAGKFYEAQKVITEILESAAKIAPSENIPDEKKEALGKGKKSSDAKLEARGMDFANAAKMFQEFPQQVAKFVSICADIEKEKLLEDAYPEEVNKAFGVCLELNDVMENLKNSVAPIGKLGVK